jgi:adhesin transport system outer membrane protein
VSPTAATTPQGEQVQQAEGNSEVGVTTPPAYQSLKEGTQLAQLAEKLDQVAIEESSALQELRAARAALRARAFDRYPDVVPTGSAPLNSDTDASIGLTLEQALWDGGRVRANLRRDELAVADAAFRAWGERNEEVLEGLIAFTEMSRFEYRLQIYSDLVEDLTELDERLKTRAEGGVADRGERLRMIVALQETERDKLSDERGLRRARSDLIRKLPDENVPAAFDSFESASASCGRAWPGIQAPTDAIAEIQVESAVADEQLLKARRFPRLVLAAGLSTLGSPQLGLALDADDMLGLGRQNTIDAAEASTQAQRALYRQRQEDTNRELERLEEDYTGLQKDIVQLSKLIATNDETLDLFKEQVQAGSIPITEGIFLYQEAADARITMADLRADLVRNCLESAALRGVLVPFRDAHER